MEKGNLVITIGRQYGSGGRKIGKMLAAELGVPFYDQEILKMTSEISAVGEQYFRLADERAGNKLLYKIVGGLRNSLEEPSVNDGITAPDNLFRFQSAVIRKLAQEQSCVIVGRCADYVLASAGHEALIRLFVYADLSLLIKRVIEVDGIETKEAMKRINRINKERKEYHHYYTGRDWNDMINYDLPVNTSHLSLEQSLALIKEYIKISGHLD